MDLVLGRVWNAATGSIDHPAIETVTDDEWERELPGGLDCQDVDVV